MNVMNLQTDAADQIPPDDMDEEYTGISTVSHFVTVIDEQNEIPRNQEARPLKVRRVRFRSKPLKTFEPIPFHHIASVTETRQRLRGTSLCDEDIRIPQHMRDILRGITDVTWIFPSSPSMRRELSITYDWQDTAAIAMTLTQEAEQSYLLKQDFSLQTICVHFIVGQLAQIMWDRGEHPRQNGLLEDRLKALVTEVHFPWIMKRFGDLIVARNWYSERNISRRQPERCYKVQSRHRNTPVPRFQSNKWACSFCRMAPFNPANWRLVAELKLKKKRNAHTDDGDCNCSECYYGYTGVIHDEQRMKPPRGKHRLIVKTCIVTACSVECLHDMLQLYSRRLTPQWCWALCKREYPSGDKNGPVTINLLDGYNPEYDEPTGEIQGLLATKRPDDRFVCGERRRYPSFTFCPVCAMGSYCNSCHRDVLDSNAQEFVGEYN